MSFNKVNQTTGELTQIAGKGIKGDPGTGLLPHFIIVSDTGSTVTVTTPSGDTIIPRAVSTDHWECDVPEYGVYTIDAVLAGDDAQVTVTVDDVKIYTIDDSHFHASITATFPNGASCRCYKDSVVYYATSTPYTFSVNSVGTWTVECTYNGVTKSQTVTITTEGQSESTTIEYASIEVTYVDAIKGLTISCTDGTTTYTKTAPSSSNTVTFTIPTIGNWTVSTTDGTLVSSETVTVSSMTSYSVELTFGFDYKQWVTLGGLDPTDYASLSDVFADEVAVRRLMTIHASADYLIENVTDDVDVIDDFTVNDTAMKWIGLRDYVCDGLTAITGVEAKFLASQYWERYLKDHVPTMTSNTAPYGTVSMTTGYTGSSAYQSFANSDSVNAALVTGTSGSIQYKFTNPINIKKVTMKENGNAQQIAINAMAKDVTFSVSNDGSTWVNVGTASNTDVTLGKEYVHNIDYDGYYLYFRISASNNNGQSAYTQFGKLQFYGRSLNVSVPVMTSNTAPYGEAFGDVNITDAWKAFDSSSSSYPTGANALEHYWGYVFPSKTKVKMAMIYSSSIPTDHMYIESADSKTGTFSGEEFTATANANYTYFVDLSNVNENKAIRLRLTKSTNFGGAIGTLQFYGVDYSEKEFEQGTTRKWLYDHGVEVVAFDFTSFKQGTSVLENDGNYLRTGGGYSANQGRELMTDQKVDVSNNDFVMARFGDEIVGQEGLEVSSDKPTSYSTMGTYRLSNVTVPSPINHLILSINISSINQDVIIGVGSRSTGAVSLAKTTISELWLE